jgi:hypothetical protein
MRKLSIGVFAIAVLAASINVAAAQRVEPTPMAGGGPGALPSPGEGPFATIPSHPETLPLAGGGPGTCRHLTQQRHPLNVRTLAADTTTNNRSVRPVKSPVR